jgi:hypothetical protein
LQRFESVVHGLSVIANIFTPPAVKSSQIFVGGNGVTVTSRLLLAICLSGPACPSPRTVLCRQ